jgi:flagellin
VDSINLCTQYGAENAIDAMDRAIKQISSARSTMGSYQNRLETTASSLTLSSQNITEAMSRIGDTDMADEMTKYTQQDVLSQAATSMLAQANNRPQQIMALLQ